MKHVYLSPHLDDAVLSCGGTIHRQISAGDEVSVITIFAGEYQGSQPSPFALEQHGYWGNPPLPMALRRAEDVAALDLLGARFQHLDFLDAVYRAGEPGQWLYPDVEALFGPLHPDDALGQNGEQGLAEQLAGLIPPNHRLIYAPLGVGRHVDHQIVHTATRWLREQGCRLAYYEDYPYAAIKEDLQAALKFEENSWQATIIPLSEAALEAKIEAVASYESQLSTFYSDRADMENAVRRFTKSTGGERVWVRIDS